MAGVEAKDIEEYGNYLKDQGHDPKEIAEYQKYLADQHSVSGVGQEGFVDKHRGAIQGALDALPTAGAVGGGAMGAVAGGVFNPGTGLLGAGLGGAGGEALKNLGEKYILGKDKTRNDIYLNPVKGFGEGVASEAGGQAIGAGINGLLGKGAEQAANAAGIKGAADRLGTKPTQGMLSNGYLERGLENSVGQDPTIAGALVRRQQEPVYGAVQGATDQLLSDGTKASAYQAGRDMKGNLIADLHERYDPIKAVYDEAKESTPHIDVSEASRERVSRNMMSSSEKSTLPDTPASRLAQSLSTKLQGADTVDKILQLQSIAKKVSADPTASVLEKDIASDALDRTQRLYQNSIMRQAISSARTPGEGGEIGKDLIGQIKDANKQYASLMGDTNSLGEGSGLFKPKRGKGIGGITNEINKTPNEDIGQAVFDTGNNDYLDFLKDKHPEVYNQAKSQYVGSIADKSLSPQGETDPKKFLKAIKGLTPEAREHLFGAESGQKIDDIQTLLNATPTKVGASDTPRGQAFQQTMNPLEQAKSMANYLLLKTGIPLAKSKIGQELGGRALGRGLLHPVDNSKKALETGVGLLQAVHAL